MHNASTDATNPTICVNNAAPETNERQRRMFPVSGGPLISGLKSRKRLITFRLNLNEYEEVKEAFSAEGWRSLSEFARAAVMQRVQARRTKTVSLGEDLLTLSAKLEELDSALTSLSGHIRRVLGSNGNKERRSLASDGGRE